MLSLAAQAASFNMALHLTGNRPAFRMSPFRSDELIAGFAFIGAGR